MSPVLLAAVLVATPLAPQPASGLAPRESGSQSFRVVSDDVPAVQTPMHRRSTGMYVAGWSMLGAGVNSLVVGGVLCVVGATGGAGCGSPKIAFVDVIGLGAGAVLIGLGTVFVLIGGKQQPVDVSAHLSASRTFATLEVQPVLGLKSIGLSVRF